jgi:TIR domain
MAGGTWATSPDRRCSTAIYVKRCRLRLTEEAVRSWEDPARLKECLDRILPPPPPVYDVFISYATGDSSLAEELKEDLQGRGLRCFMAEKDIPVAVIWETEIRNALLGSKRILLLLTPRSVTRPWVLMETGAAWALKKDLIPALVQVSSRDLVEPIRNYQARIIETLAQRKNLVEELLRT